MTFDGLKRKRHEKEHCNKWRNQIWLIKKDDKLLVGINISLQSGNFKEKREPNTKCQANNRPDMRVTLLSQPNQVMKNGTSTQGKQAGLWFQISI